jgi:uncharacterized protein
MIWQDGAMGPIAAQPLMSNALSAKYVALQRSFLEMGHVVVAFSGGADSSLLAYVASSTEGVSATAVTAVSPSLAGAEFDDCSRLAESWSLEWVAVTTNEMEQAAYRRNDADRCFHCKSALMEALQPFVDNGATVVLGVNVDDLDDHRPGQRAAAEAGARFPFVEVGLSKAEIRELSHAVGLETWDKPAAACLASRIPFGTEVTVEILSKVERAEQVLRDLGIRSCRVRHHGEVARIEVEQSDLQSVIDSREHVEQRLLALGFRYVTVDLGGFRSGSLNPHEPTANS